MKSYSKNCFLHCFIGLFLLVGCGKKGNNELLILRDVWKLDQTQINSFDPLDAYHSYHIQLTKQLFNTLTDLDSSGKIKPSLAKSWETKDGRNWLFLLKDNVWFVKDSCFSSFDDRKFKADDVLYTFKRLLNPDSKSLGTSYFINILGAKNFIDGLSDSIEGIKVINDYSISFTLEKPDYNFPNLLSLPFSSIVNEIAIKSKDCKGFPIGTGPFILEKYLPNKSIILVKNPDYWEKNGDIRLPVIEKIEILLTNDDNYSFLLFKNRKTDFLELTIPMEKQLENSKLAFEYNRDIIKSAQLNFYLFNLDKIKDSKIRRGINYAIDRVKIQRIIGENGDITNSLYPKLFKTLIKPNILLESNKEKAKQLLERPMRIKLVTFDDIISRSIANQFLEDLKPFDIELEIEAVPFSVLVDRLISGNYDMIQLYWGMLYADVNHFLTPFKSSSFPPVGNNFNHYSNKQLDSLVNIAAQLPEIQQVKLYEKVENIILSDMPFLLTYYKNIIILSDKKYTLPMNSLLYKLYKEAELAK